MHHVQLALTDIDTCIRFNRVRCLFSIVALILMSSDIPRTGLGIKALNDVMKPETPESGVYYGPYAYSIGRIVKETGNSSRANYNGSSGSSAITSAAVWPYKFDSVSIPLRALVQVVKIQPAWPSCVMYFEECSSPELTLETTFTMLDTLINAVHHKEFPFEVVGATSRPFVYVTRSRWIDRWHHYSLSLLGWWREEYRLSSVHFYRIPSGNATLDVCSPGIPHTHRPFVCDLATPYKCKALTGPDIATSSSKMLFSTHLKLRVARLQRQYPTLSFDLTLVASDWVRSNANDHPPIRWALYRNDMVDMTTLIRGRYCAPSHSNCETVVIDDYRYERTSLVTDVNHWYNAAGTLRCVAQGYVWLRVTALWLGCFKARSIERKFAQSSIWTRVFYTWTTFFRIPGHILVYSSWLPVVCYAIAHLMDNAIVHIRSDILGASFNGSASFDFWTNLHASSVQMRNIWMLAILVKAIALIQSHGLPQRWHRRHGLRGIRGGWIGWLSSLTIVGPLQSLSFRDTRVLDVHRLSSDAALAHAHLPLQCEYGSEFGFRLDVKTLSESAIITLGLLMAVKLCLWLGHLIWKDRAVCKSPLVSRFATNVVFSRSHYVPYSVGTLFDSSCLSIYWSMKLVDPGMPNRGHANRKAVAPYMASAQARTTCGVCHVSRCHWGWPGAQGCPEHDDIFRIERRSAAVWSMVQLINLAMLTDPIVWLSLYAIGRRLYLYRIETRQSPETEDERHRGEVNVLLPCSPQQLDMELESEERGRYELLDVIDSASVPWRLLLQCG